MRLPTEAGDSCYRAAPKTLSAAASVPSAGAIFVDVTVRAEDLNTFKMRQ